MKPLEKKPGSRILLYLLLLIAALSIMFGLKNCRRFSHGPAAGADTLKGAMQYAPGSFYVDGDTLAGRDYEALVALNIPYRIYPITDPAEGLSGLRQGRYDLVIADLPQTADSARDYIFTEPIYLDRQVLVQRVDSDGATPAITSPLQLGGKTVTVPDGSPMASRLANLAREIGENININPRRATTERLLTELALGADSVSLVVANSTLAAEIAREYPTLDYSVPVSLTQFQSWVLRPSDARLRDSLNSRLRRLDR